jgi:general secretion pathway protein L
MEGVVRAQIDRLTPWTADESAFGWSKPAASRPDHFIITIAASARASVMPYVNALTARGAHSVAVFASLPSSDHASAPVKILEESSTSATNLHWLRRVLMMILLGAGLAAGIATAASFMIGADLDEQQRELAHKIASARTVVGSGHDDPVGSIASARRVLERRKHEDPIVVLVVDALSQILPDNTYVTELAVDGKKMRVTGVTQDAPNLIGLIERSGRFSHATFFAPTTRAPANAGEHFHIDADINPMDGPGS